MVQPAGGVGVLIGVGVAVGGGTAGVGVAIKLQAPRNETNKIAISVSRKYLTRVRLVILLSSRRDFNIERPGRQPIATNFVTRYNFEIDSR